MQNSFPTSTQEETQTPHKLGHSTKDITFHASYFFKPSQISETEKIGKFYWCVFESFALAEKKIGVRCTLSFVRTLA